MGSSGQWAPKDEQKLEPFPGLQDVASDLEQRSPQLMIRINRDLASRLGINPTRSKAHCTMPSASAT